MKPIKYIIAAGIISAALFTGCKKEDNSANNLTGPMASETISGPAGNVSYALQTLLPPGTLIEWQEGKMTESALLFDGTHVFGNMLKRQEFVSSEHKTVNLFGNPVLGSVNVPVNFYWSAAFKIELNSFDGAHALVLNGTYNTNRAAGNAKPMPVQLIIDQPVMLQSEWIKTVTINTTNYVSSLTLDLSQVTNGITTEMLEGADKTMGRILINNSNNTVLYNIIVSNLQNNMLGAQFSVMNTTTTSASN